MEPIGRIFGEPTDDIISMVSLKYYSGKFAQTQEPNTGLFSVYKITENKARNRNFAAPENIKYLHPNEDIAKDVIYLFEARRIASVKDGKLNEQILPAYPGQLVYQAEDRNVAAAYGIDPTGIPVGGLSHAKDVRVCLNPDKIFNPHLLVVGRTGSGKSYFTQGLVRQMQKADWTVLIFSPSDEYNNVVKSVQVIQSRDVVLPYNEYSMEYLWGLTASESLQLKRFPPDDRTVYSSEKYVQWIIDSYRKGGRRSTQKGNAQHQMSFFPSEDPTGVAFDFELPAVISSLINKISKRKLNFSSNANLVAALSRTAVIDLSQSTQTDQECILNVLMQQLLWAKKRQQTHFAGKYLVVIEEAHNYVPSVRSTLCKETIIKLAGKEESMEFLYVS